MLAATGRRPMMMMSEPGTSPHREEPATCRDDHAVRPAAVTMDGNEAAASVAYRTTEVIAVSW